jgi:hypothetical protein
MALTDEQLDQARRDPVVFADLVLRQPLWPHQVAVVRSTARTRVLCWGRRAGKTRVFGVVALHRMFAVPGTRVMMVSAGRTSVVRSHREIAGMARQGLGGSSIEDDQVMTLTLSNGSILESVTQSVTAVRSADVDLLIVDEAAFVDEAVWDAAEPTIIARPGSQVLMASTPWRGPGHFFHDMWRAGMDGGSGIESWHLPSTASPLVDAAELAVIRDRKSPDAFAREYLAEWSAASGSFFDSAEIDGAAVEGLEVDPGDPAATAGAGGVVGGVDWGMRRDAHALVVIGALPETDDRGRTRYAVRFVEERYQMDYETWIERLAVLGGPAGFAFQTVAAESNGVGQMPQVVLARRLWEVTGRDVVTPVTTTAQLKENAFGFAKLLLQQGRLQLPKHPTLLTQLRALEFMTTDSGVMRLAVPDRVGHDDVAMAFAFALLPLMAGELVPAVDQVLGIDDVLGEDWDDWSISPY